MSTFMLSRRDKNQKHFPPRLNPPAYAGAARQGWSILAPPWLGAVRQRDRLSQHLHGQEQWEKDQLLRPPPVTLVPTSTWETSVTQGLKFTFPLFEKFSGYAQSPAI